ncbi:MAG TPA: DNA-formamidopyrimidine glycosylase family protein [Pseudonocardiaceae bacterium]|jgi:endonuclease-8|nr:DNA-formamidopyrimidine glycosylase family protein [Pseudonocardiaceae bacterium]
MPEGDTVFLAGHRLDDALAGGLLVRAELRHPKLVGATLAGLTVLGVRSVGKHLFTRFDDGTSLHSHFKMDGAWHLYRAGDRWRGRTHDIRAILATDTWTAVGFRLHDLALLRTDREADLVGHLGPDLLADDWNDDMAATAVQRLAAVGDREIADALADQRVMAGVGNLYKAEICFLLGVTPWTLVPRLSDAQLGRAVALSRKLLHRNAWRPEQSTTGELAPGRRHWVYQRTGKPCLRCGTRVETAVQGLWVPVRHTWFCPKCQAGPRPGSM